MRFATPCMSSKKTRDARQRIADMLNAIAKIRTYTAGLDEAAFGANSLVFDATVRNFEVLGEAAKHVPAGLWRHYTDAPWQKIIDLRNWVAHDYADASPAVLWKTVERRLGPLEAALRAMLHEIEH
jgi:uncharacterized protein with HEPN domain